MALPQKHVSKPEEVFEEGFPKCVYHKDFDPNGDEKNLLKHSKVVHSEEAHKKLGADWDIHPSLKEKVVKEVVDSMDEKPKKKLIQPKEG